jgi:hypothetical protein
VDPIFGLAFGWAQDPIAARVEARIGSRPRHYVFDALMIALSARATMKALLPQRVATPGAPAASAEKQVIAGESTCHEEELRVNRIDRRQGNAATSASRTKYAAGESHSIGFALR